MDPAMSASIQKAPDIGKLSPAFVAGVDAEVARRLLGSACAPVGFDRVGLAAAVASFPVPRSTGQGTLSGTWGRVGSLVGVQRVHTVAGGAGLGWREGRSFRIVVGPGLASCASFDATRRERAVDREREAGHREADLLGGRLLADPERGFDLGPSFRQVVGWSAKSRSRMVKGFASVDWSALARCYCGHPMSDLEHTYVAFKRCKIASPMPMGMVTLTYPGDWLALAPTGAAAKRHLALFRQRWVRALGWRLDGAWKLEFQKPRGWRVDDERDYGASTGQEAPHFHLLLPIPATVKGQDFRAWLSATWADVVGADGVDRLLHEAAGTRVDFGRTAKMSDPKRCAVYFLKHGSKTLDSKEYQHNVPTAWVGLGYAEELGYGPPAGSGPGRFWGFWGMSSAAVVLDLDLGDWLTARRVMRHVAKSRAAGVAYSRARAAAAAAGRPGDEFGFGRKRAKLPNLGSAGRVPRDRRLRTLGAGGQLSGGWVVVNDGVSLASSLSRALRLRREVEADWGNGIGLDFLPGGK